MPIEFGGLPLLGPGPSEPLGVEELRFDPAAAEFEVFGHDVSAQHATVAGPLDQHAQVIRVTVTEIGAQIKFCFQHLLTAVRVIPSIVKGHPLEDLENMASIHQSVAEQLRALEHVMELEPGAETVLSNPSPTPPPRRRFPRFRELEELGRGEEGLAQLEHLEQIERAPVFTLPKGPSPAGPPPQPFAPAQEEGAGPLPSAPAPPAAPTPELPAVERRLPERRSIE